MLSRVLVLFAMTSVALAAIARQQLDEKPEEYKDCEGCYVLDIQRFIPINETWLSPTGCKKYRCTETYVEWETCGAIGVEPPCYVTRDMSLLYPKCCGTIVCPPKKREGKQKK